MARTAIALHHLKLLPGVSEQEFLEFFRQDLSPSLTPNPTRAGAVEGHRLLRRQETESDSVEIVWMMEWHGVNTSAAGRVSQEIFREHQTEIEKHAVRVAYHLFDQEAAFSPFSQS